METNIYDCCNDESRTRDLSNTPSVSSTLSNNNCCCRSNNCCDPVEKTIRSIDDNLCDIKVTLAETKVSLLYLAQTLCNNGCIDPTERLLLLSLEKQIKNLNSKLGESKENLEYLNCLLH